MTHISEALVPVQPALGEVEETTVVEVDETALRKAQYVLRTFKHSGLKMPYDTEIEDMALVWAAPLARFSTGVLDDAIAEWRATETECPAVGEMESLCGQIVAENMRRSAEADARVRNPEGKWCDECGVEDEEHPDHGHIRGYNMRYVRVEDPDTTITSPKGVPILVTGNHHMRPCSLCLPDAYDLYKRGHFSGDHRARGGCKECRDYLPGQGGKKKREPGRIG